MRSVSRSHRALGDVPPVQPAKRVTATTQTDSSELDPDDKRRQRHADHSGDRGATLDVEV